ncbi:MAG TPA: hypothetical protein VGJ75_03960, partial [Dongiaceae bacterium]
ALPAGLFYEKILSTRLRWPFLFIAIYFLEIAVQPVVAEYRVMAMRALDGKELRYGAAYQIADYLKRENKSGRPVYMLTDHIVYWLIGQYPPTRWVHPSNIIRRHALEALVGKEATTEEELTSLVK